MQETITFKVSAVGEGFALHKVQLKPLAAGRDGGLRVEEELVAAGTLPMVRRSVVSMIQLTFDAGRNAAEQDQAEAEGKVGLAD